MKLSWTLNNLSTTKSGSTPCACFGYAKLDGVVLAPELSDNNYNKKLSNRISAVKTKDELFNILRQLEGFFSGWLIIEDTINCFSDYLGLCPIFIYSKGNRYTICEDPSEISEAPDHPVSLDIEQLNHFVQNGNFRHTGTAFKEVTQIWGAHIYSFTLNGSSSIQAYLNLSDFDTKPSQQSDKLLPNQTNKILETLISSYLRGQEHYTIPLSGGLDSRQLSWIAHKRNKAKGYSFTFGENDSPDMKIARRVAPLLNLPHKSYILDYAKWLDNARIAIVRTRGQITISQLVPPPSLIDEYVPIGPLISGVGGNITLGGSSVMMKHPSSTELKSSLKSSASLQFNNIPGLYLEIIKKWPEFYRLIIDLRRRHYPTFRDVAYGQYRLPLLERSLVTSMLQIAPHHRAHRKLQIKMAFSSFSKALLEIPMNSTMKPLKIRGNFMKRVVSSIRYRTEKFIGSLPREELYNNDLLWRLHGKKMRETVVSSGLLNKIGPLNAALGESFQKDCALYTLAVSYSAWLSEGIE